MLNKKMVRVIAVVLAVLLVGGVVFSALVSALSEEQTAVDRRSKNRCEISMEYLTDAQALRVTQRLHFYNPGSQRLDSVLFYATGNMFRRYSALMYDTDAWGKVFPEGYVPAGIDLRSVTCDALPADFGFQGEQEMVLRVACDLDPGQSCTFEFEYYLLLMRCGAFQGAGETDVRLSAFCFIPGAYDRELNQFLIRQPVSHTRWLYCDATDYSVRITLPRGYILCGSGTTSRSRMEGESVVWSLQADGVRDLALSFGRRWRIFEGQSASGVVVRVLTNVRGIGKRALSVAIDAIDRCEEWFGTFPVRHFDIAQSDYPLGYLNFTGTCWLSSDLFKASGLDELAQRIRYCVAQQYFGLSAYVEPVADAWMTAAISQYVACLLMEAAEGQDRMLAHVNRDWVSALQQTVPGGLRITSDAALFDADSFQVVVLDRGAVVLHELRLAMGLDDFLKGLKRFWEMGADGHTLTEMELVEALDAASGGSWESFLTDWLFNVGDYARQNMTWYE